MVKRKGIRDDRGARVERAPKARGGVSPGGILTGVVVAFGAIFLLSAVIGGVLAATGAAADSIDRADVVSAGIAGGIAFAVSQFLAYLWGGYTAGRMARGAGVLNGVLVPIVAIVLALIVGAIAAALGATAELNLPLREGRLPLEDSYAVDWGLGLGIAALVLMFVGGALGGMLGARWHTKLERRAEEEVSGAHLREDRDRSAARDRRADDEHTDDEHTDVEGARTTRQPRG